MRTIWPGAALTGHARGLRGGWQSVAPHPRDSFGGRNAESVMLSTYSHLCHHSCLFFLSFDLGYVILTPTNSPFSFPNSSCKIFILMQCCLVPVSSSFANQQQQRKKLSFVNGLVASCLLSATFLHSGCLLPAALHSVQIVKSSCSKSVARYFLGCIIFSLSVEIF